jgi:hypothetical protein
MSDRDTRPRSPSQFVFSRRRFVRSVAAGGGAAIALSPAVWTPRLLADHDHSDHDHHDHDDDKKLCEGESGRAASICQAPNPIPHLGATPFGVSIHGFFPGPVEGTATPTDPTGAHPAGRDPSGIYDFRGFIGQADLDLTGSGTDLNSHATAPYSFHADMRFMKGVFVGTDGREHKGAFAFI